MKTGKVILIGGGIGGLTTAIGLRSRGFDVRIYERKRVHTEIGALIVLFPNALLALDALGAAKILLARCEAVETGLTRTARGELLSEIPMSRFRDELGMPLMAFHRADLLQYLVDQVDPEIVSLDHECTGFEQDEEGATVYFANGSSDRADLVVGADGIHSVIRRRLFPNGSSLIYTGRTSWRACAYGASELPMRRNVVFDTVGGGGRVGIAYIGDGRIGWYANLSISQREAESIHAPKARLLREFGHWPDPVGPVIEATEESNMVRTKILRFAPLPSWTRGRTTLLGDAAHAMSPDLGQGACMAIEDACVLVNCLSREESVPAALRSYETRRIPRTTQIMRRSAVVGKIFNWNHPLLSGLRNRLLKSMSGERSFQQFKKLLAFDPSAT